MGHASTPAARRSFTAPPLTAPHTTLTHARASEKLAASGDPSFAIKRRWDDDVVFRNQTRGQPKAQRRFINDTIRNDFHRRFLERYVR